MEEGCGYLKSPGLELVEPVPNLSAIFNTMRINRAIGLGIAIIVLKLLMATTFAALENTLLVFFNTASVLFAEVGNGTPLVPALP